MTEIERLAEEKIESESVFEGEILHIKKDLVSLPNKDTAIREVVRHIGAVCVVPVTEDGKVVMERQFRYPIDQVISEIPAGKLDFHDEDRLLAAKRELREETGFTADTWVDMGIYYPAAAYSDEKITMYLATGLKKGEQCLDDDEFLDVELIPIEELVKRIIDGDITDGKTQVAILKAFMILKKQVV